MKKIISTLILSLLCFASFSQTKLPSNINIIKEFSGVILNSGLYNGGYSFTIKDYKLGEITLHFLTDGNAIGSGDPYEIECKISDDLDGKLRVSEANGTKVKVKAKSTYGIFENYAGTPNFKKKRIIWRPMEVIIIK